VPANLIRLEGWLEAQLERRRRTDISRSSAASDTVVAEERNAFGHDPGWRGRYLAFIDRHDIAWELAMAVLAVAYVVVGFAAADAPAGDEVDLSPTRPRCPRS
jgi:hypothetical protein